MVNIKKIILEFLILLVILSSYCYPSKTRVEIEISGTNGLNFQGCYGDLNGGTSVSGVIPETYRFEGEGIVSAVFQKMEEYGVLEVSIEVDGKKLNSQYTTAPYGVVSVTADLFDLELEKHYSKKDQGGGTMGLIIGILFALFVGIGAYEEAKKRRLTEVKIVERPKLCSHCGKYYEGTPNFCPNCGQNLKSENRNSKNQQKMKMEESKKHCPFCNSPLTADDIFKGICSVCHRVF